MSVYQILYWKDIPAQVRVFPESGRPISRPMPQRFQQEIDAKAMQEGLTGSEYYLQHWHWTERRERDLPPGELLDVTLRELDQEHQSALK